MRLLLPALCALALFASACDAGDADTTTDADGIDVPEDVPDTPTQPEGAATDQPDASDTTDSRSPEADAGVFDPSADHPVEARPGRWAVGDAGVVEFDLTDAGLVLVAVSEADGWAVTVDEESADEIEVDFTRDNTEIEIEIEWEGGVLEIEIDTDIEDAQPGAYDLGPAGAFEFARDAGGLRLVGVAPGDGWALQMEEESADEIEFELRAGAEHWDVEIDLDDGVIDIEMDYEVTGTPAG